MRRVLFSFYKGSIEMSENILLTVIELFSGILIEGVILAMVFNWISDKSQDNQQEHLQKEMQNLEKQNKFDFEQLQKEIRDSKTDIINQIKESTASKKGGN
jgi:hypothetical protein